jgi:hypothetical protein
MSPAVAATLRGRHRSTDRFGCGPARCRTVAGADVHDRSPAAPHRNSARPDDAGAAVVWSVVSEDGHTISGSFVYSAGLESATAEVDDDGRAGTRLVGGVGRRLAFAGTLGLAGALAYAVLFLPGGRQESEQSVTRRLRALGIAAGVVAAIGAALALWGPGGHRGDALLASWGALADVTDRPSTTRCGPPTSSTATARPTPPSPPSPRSRGRRRRPCSSRPASSKACTPAR